MTLASEYLQIVDRIAASTALPAIREIHIAGEAGQTGKSSKFGAMVLEDGSVGLTYVDLDDARQSLLSESLGTELVGCSPVEAAGLYAGDATWQRVLGMAAINAISQHVFSSTGFELTESAKSIDLMLTRQSDHVGMVGYFPPLVERIRALDIPLTVIELDPQWVQHEQGFEVTLDPARLSGCNKVLCTGTVLINQTLDEILANTRDAEQCHLVGPTVGCLPDPLFRRGITSVGGRQVTDSNEFVVLWRSGQPWRAVTRRYSLIPLEYPGLKALLASLE